MHRHDLDLIAALAEGSLENEDRARALIDECTVCRAEYDSQRSVIERLGAVSSASMTAAEKAALHRDVLTGLAEGARDAATSRQRAPWTRWAYAAAGVFVIAGALGALYLGGVTENMNAGFDGGDQSPTQGLGEVDGGGPMRVSTTVTTGEEGNPAPPDDGTTPPATGDTPWEPLVEEARDAAGPDVIAEYADAETAELALTCIEEAGLDRSDYRIIGTVEETSEYLMVIPAEIEFDPSTPLTVVDFETCQVVAVEG